MTVKDSVKDTAERATAYTSDKLHAVGGKLQDAGEKIGDAASAASAGAGDVLAAARDKVVNAYGAAADRTGAAYDNARETASNAYTAARDTASGARIRTSDGIDESPIAAVIGGIAVGVLLGALLPRSQRETQALGPIGDKLAGIARDAFSAAREAGQGTLDEMGINKAGAREQLDKLIDTASKAASSAGAAAADTIRPPQA